MSHRSDRLHGWLNTEPVRGALRSRDPLIDQHAVQPFDLATWRRHIADPDALGLAAEYDGRMISRGDLARHADQALKQDTDAAWVRAYMACQLWGVGRSGRIHWTARTLQDPSTPAAFASLARAVTQGEPERAAGRWADGWNRSFTTKFAYAVAKAVDNARPAALIYDDRVARRLAQIGWRPPERGTGRRKAWRRYAGYLDAIHEHAERIGCRPDTIEWILFDPPREAT